VIRGSGNRGATDAAPFTDPLQVAEGKDNGNPTIYFREEVAANRKEFARDARRALRANKGTGT